MLLLLHLILNLLETVCCIVYTMTIKSGKGTPIIISNLWSAITVLISSSFYISAIPKFNG